MSGGILSGNAIREAVQCGEIRISGFNEEQLNVASYDVRLGNAYAQYDRTSHYLDTKNKKHYEVETRRPPMFLLNPGQLYLMHTEERIWARKYVPVLDGKSSVGRLGIFIHVTAGYGDPGFDGQYTLEVMVLQPVTLYAGMRIGQIRFHTLVGDVDDYQTKGHYVGEAAQGPVPSQLWKQFIELKKT